MNPMKTIWKLVQRRVQSWSQSTIRSASLSLGSVIYSIIAVSILPFLKDIEKNGAWASLLSVLVSALALSLLVRTIQYVLLNIWAKPVLGSWVYKSTSGNWGLATIHLIDNELKYNVNLYPDENSVRAAANGEYGFGEKIMASVDSISVEYNRGTLTLIYLITQTNKAIYAPREGMLKLTPLPGNSAMKGWWKSDIEGSNDPKSGQLDLVRLRNFLNTGKTSSKDATSQKLDENL